MKLVVPFLALLFSCTAGHGLDIRVHFVPNGQQLGTFGIAHAAPATNQGGGDIREIMEVAASYWESAFADSHVVDLDYGWYPREGSATATHRLVSEGGTPHREIAGTIAFDTDVLWFLDPTPLDSSEFSNFTAYTMGGMNVGREWIGGTGPASNRDFLSTAIHEIGHALGLSSANDAFRALAGSNTPGATRTIVLGFPLPFAGTSVIIDDDSAHLNNATYDHAALRGSRGTGVRRFPSALDVLVNAEISQFVQINLNPAPFPECSIATNPDGTISIEFRGILQWSPDLKSWSSFDPQPQSPFEFSSIGEGYFRSVFE